MAKLYDEFKGWCARRGVSPSDVIVEEKDE